LEFGYAYAIAKLLNKIYLNEIWTATHLPLVLESDSLVYETINDRNDDRKREEICSTVDDADQ